MDIGTKIKELREANDMTLEELGNKVGVGKSTVRKWETGLIANMRRDKIAKLADALHCSPGYLMGWEDATATAPAADPLYKKISLLDTIGRIKTEAFVDGLLSSQQYAQTGSVAAVSAAAAVAADEVHAAMEQLRKDKACENNLQRGY